MARQEALITPSVIKWAREKAHYTTNVAAKKIGVRVEKLKEWEAGISLPTVTQARKMSQVYRRPFASFYLAEPPRDFSLLKDFRTVEGKVPQYSTALVFLMRQIQEKQAWLTEYLKDQGHEPLKFIGSNNLQSSPKVLAKKIIKTIWGDEREYSQLLDIKNRDLLSNWINQCEEKGIFISRTSNFNSHHVISVTEARGFVISDQYAPFIFVNSGDSKNAQLFTLLHELAHLWLNISGVPDHFDTHHRQRKFSGEFLCNQTAAEILMPENKIRSLKTIRNQSPAEISGFIKKHSKDFQVSRLALLIRLKSFSMIKQKDFKNLKRTFIEEYEDHKKRQRKRMNNSSSGPNANVLKLNSNGENFTKIVIYSYKEGLISGREASNLLDIKLNRMEKMISITG